MGSEKRKLQTEIDKCIKKIQEGVDEFDVIWGKVQDATNANQKEKFETDLKKEIKKLQRLREQVKNWIASGDIKDKSQLSEYRRVIESKMEQFKVVERETKTKAYSKQGLGAEQKLDPKEKEKEDTICWLQDSIYRLSQQSDKFEAEIEHISAAAGKKRKLDKEKQEKIDEHKRHLERHRFHVLKLELLMRLVTNSSLEPVQVAKIHDDLEYYITNNEEQDFEENDFMYDDLNLGDVEQLAQQMGTLSFNQDDLENNSETNTTTSVSPSASPAPSLNSKVRRDSNTRESEEGKARHVSEGVEEIAKPVVTRGVSSTVSRSTPTTPLKLTSQLSLDSAVSTPPPTGTPPLAASAGGMSYNSVAAGVSKSATKMSASSATSAMARVAAATSATFDVSALSKVPSAPARATTTTANADAFLNAGAAVAATVVTNSSASLTLAATTSSSNQPPTITAAIPVLAMASTQPTTTVVAGRKTPSAGSTEDTAPAVVSNGPSSESRKSIEDCKAQNERPSSTAIVPNQGNPSQNCTTVSIAATSTVANMPQMNVVASSLLTNSNTNSILPPGNVVNASVLMGYNALNSAAQLQLQQQQQKTQEANIPPLLGASPLGKVQITQEHATQLSALEHSMRHPPLPSDSERLRTHLPRSPCQVPPHYPQTPPPLSDVLEYFNHLQPETLFFIFYYLEGTKAQYLAARALKRQSWRFHTKYMMWFQRHEEPKTITEEFEQVRREQFYSCVSEKHIIH